MVGIGCLLVIFVSWWSMFDCVSVSDACWLVLGVSRCVFAGAGCRLVMCIHFVCLLVAHIVTVGRLSVVTVDWYWVSGAGDLWFAQGVRCWCMFMREGYYWWHMLVGPGCQLVVLFIGVGCYCGVCLSVLGICL